MSQSSKPTPIAIPNDLAAQIEEVSTLTGLSKQDVMRLCMRIGIVDLKAADHDFPGIVKRIADDKGVSFQAFAKAEESKRKVLPIGKRREVKYTSGGSAHLENAVAEEHAKDDAHP